MVDPSFVSLFDCAKRNVGEQGRYDPALRGAGFCSEESILRQDACCQELSDQPYHLLIGDAGAQPIEKQMMVDVVEAALDVPLDDPSVWCSMAPTIALALAGADGLPDVLQGTVTPSSRSEPVRDMPELRLEDWLQNILDRGLNHAISDRRNAQGSVFPRFPRLGDQLTT
jgi:hypothetical protein